VPLDPPKVDYKLFSVRNIVAWALAVEVLGLAVLPGLRAFFGNRRDSALLSRPVGLALVGWCAWALSLALPFGFSRATILLSLVILAGLSLASSRRAGERTGGPFWAREENRGALYFWVPAAVFLLIRAAVPEILGAEKFMDLAFFNSLTRRPEIPPIDPWMSGHTINYYYWGYLLAAAIAKVAGVSPFVAYNLAIPTFAGYSFAAAACLGFRLSGGRKVAAIAAGFVSVFAGNLTGALDAWAKPFAKDFDYWHASRVIGKGDTINEFPFFTFFHADLHPHLLAFPFFLAAFAIADRWIEAGPGVREQKPAFDSLLRRAPPVLLVTLLVAAAIAANPWNGPALALLLVFAGAARTTRGEDLPRLGPAVAGAFVGLGMLLAALLLTQPYRASYRLPYNGIGRTHAVSGLLEFLGVWGLLLAVAVVGLLAPASDEEEKGRRRRDFALALACALSVVIAFAKKTPALLPILVLGFLAGGAGLRALRRERDRGLVVAAFLCLLALGMIAGCEFVYFKDSYGDQLHRMNTIFKFYHQAWPLLGIGAVVFAERAWRATGAARSVAFALAAIAFLSLLYPLTATVSRLRQKNAPFSLDARGALGRRNAGDLDAIAWLEKNASRTSVLMEASGDPYSDYARISSHTGIPTVLGWANHEGLWRSNDSEVGKRLGEIRLFYSTQDPRTAREILDRYRVTHVVLGNLERSTYSSGGVASFPFLQPVHPGNTTVYAVAR
jgi:YYY domain-containing protein